MASLGKILKNMIRQQPCTLRLIKLQLISSKPFLRTPSGIKALLHCLHKSLDSASDNERSSLQQMHMGKNAVLPEQVPRHFEMQIFIMTRQSPLILDTIHLFIKMNSLIITPLIIVTIITNITQISLSSYKYRLVPKPSPAARPFLLLLHKRLQPKHPLLNPSASCLVITPALVAYSFERTMIPRKGCRIRLKRRACSKDRLCALGQSLLRPASKASLRRPARTWVASQPSRR